MDSFIDPIALRKAKIYTILAFPSAVGLTADIVTNLHTRLFKLMSRAPDKRGH